MPEPPLQVSLKAVDERLGQFTLAFNASQYPITLKPETSSTFSEWLRRLPPVLEGHNDPSQSYDPQDLLRNIGMWLWRALPESLLKASALACKWMKGARPQADCSFPLLHPCKRIVE